MTSPDHLQILGSPPTISISGVFSQTSLATQGSRPYCRMGRGITVVLGEGSWCRGVHNRLLPALLGGAGGLWDRLILLLLLFFLRPERRGRGGRICLSHGPRWPSGGRYRVGGGLQANPGGRGKLERVLHSLQKLSPPNAPRALDGSHAPSTGFWATIEMSVTHQRTLVCGPTVYHFPQASPPFFSSRVRPLSLGRPLPGFVYLRMQDALPLPFSAASPLPVLPRVDGAEDQS